jgi:hypothetical protein
VAGENQSFIDSRARNPSGRIAYVAMIHPKRGGKLWAIFDRIDWNG